MIGLAKKWNVRCVAAGCAVAGSMDRRAGSFKAQFTDQSYLVNLT